MDIYLVIIEDRHQDVEVRPFREREDAMREARSYLTLFRLENIEVEEIKGWEFSARYSLEGDCLRVEKVRLR